MTAESDALRGTRGSKIAVAGLLFSALFVLAWVLLRNAPSYDATDQELVKYYADAGARRNSTIAGLYVVPFACVAFIWFMAALRHRLIRPATRENPILSTAHVVAGALVVTSLFTLAAAELAVVWLAETGDTLDVSGARSLLALSSALSRIMAVRAAAVFVGVSGTRAVRSGLFPRSYAVLSVVTALGMLLVYRVALWVTLIFPVWVAVSSVLILVRRHAAEARPEPREA